MSSRCAIRLLGEVSVVRDGRPVELPSRQLRLLVAYVAEHGGRTISRDELGGAVWAEDVPPAAGAALRALLSRLRAAVPTAATACGGVRLGPTVSVDVATVAAEIAAAEIAFAAGAVDPALRLARGAMAASREPYCPGLQAPWLEEARAGAADLQDAALMVFCRAAVAAGEGPGAAAPRAARALCRRRPYSDAAHALLMEVQCARGDAAEALWTFEVFRRRIADELGAFPGPALRALHADLLRAPETAPPEEVAHLDAARPPLRESVHRPQGGTHARPRRELQPRRRHGGAVPRAV